MNAFLFSWYIFKIFVPYKLCLVWYILTNRLFEKAIFRSSKSQKIEFRELHHDCCISISDLLNLEHIKDIRWSTIYCKSYFWLDFGLYKT